MFDDLMHKDPWKVRSVAKYTPSVNGHITCMKMSEVYTTTQAFKVILYKV